MVLHLSILTSLIILLLISSRLPNEYFAFAGLCVFVVYAYVFLKQCPDYFALFGFLIYGQFTSVISNYYIECGGFILEQFRYGYSTGSTIRLVAYNYVFFLASYIIYYRITLNKDIVLKTVSLNYKTQDNTIKLVYAVSFALFVILFAGLFVYGSPLIMGIDRFAYWQNHPLPLLDSIRYKINVLALLFGMIAVHRKRQERKIIWPVSYLILIILINALYGDKFSGIVISIYLFMLPVWLNNAIIYHKLILSRKVILWAIVIAIGLFGLISYHYKNIAYSDAVTDLIIARAFGLQGHVWWGVDELFQKADQEKIYDPRPKDARRVLLGKEDNVNVTGLNAMMYEVSPAKLVNAYRNKNIRFTMGSPAIGLYTLGYFGLYIYQLISAAMFTMFILYFRKQILGLKVLRSAICCLILLAMYESFIMGNISILYSMYVLKYVAALIFVEIIVWIVWRNKQFATINTINIIKNK